MIAMGLRYGVEIAFTVTPPTPRAPKKGSKPICKDYKGYVFKILYKILAEASND